ncbi:MAG: FTR1 family protein [Propioniciclava sp.]
MTATRRLVVRRLPRRITLPLAVLLCILVAALSLPTHALADGLSDKSTWAEVAQQSRADLTSAVTQHAAGNTAGAAAAIARALNTDYVASNLARAISENLGAEVQSTHSEKFAELRRVALRADGGDTLGTGVEALAASVDEAAAQLDATPGLASPRDYAAALQAQTQAEREQLDAQKQNSSQGRGSATWSEVAATMNALLDNALTAVANGDARGGSELVNQAYYQYYEKLGFERTVMSAISGDRVSQVENQFKTSRKAMIAEAPLAEITQHVEALQSMLLEDAAALDGGAADNVSPFLSFFTSAFGQSFLILLREGLEAILVVAALIAYLVKAGQRDKVRYIYLGVLAGLAASVAVWFVFNVVLDAAGARQEMLEGVTAMIAMVMLLLTSNWMLTKSSASSWNAYIKDKTSQSLSSGSVGALTGLAFLAVFREGAETVMLYQALIGSRSDGGVGFLAGFAAAAVVLFLVFVLIRVTSVKIPVRQFFSVTSIFMALLVVVFAGGGIHSFIEGDVISGTYLPGMPTVDFLGLYPYRETLLAQGLALVALAVLATISILRMRRSGPAPRPSEGDPMPTQPADAAANPAADGAAAAGAITGTTPHDS